MTLEHFEKLLKGNNGISISKELVIFKDYELYNYKTKKSKEYDNLNDLVNDNPDVKKIIENAEDFYWELDGGHRSKRPKNGFFN